MLGPIERIAAFAKEGVGGNPAGVALCNALPEAAEMQRLAAAVGYSETAFAAPEGDGWRVRYFAPEAEVPFCGHATVALGAALGARHGAGAYRLATPAGRVVVEAMVGADGWRAALVSPLGWARDCPAPLAQALRELFGLEEADLDPRLPPALAHAGATHALFALRDRARLAEMNYPFDDLRRLMEAETLTTICLLTVAAPDCFQARNAFPVGGVREDPATGAAAAALAKVLLARDWPLPPSRRFTVLQGEDMGTPSELLVTAGCAPGDPARVEGATRVLPASG